jgi:hypothetical protein
MVWTETFHCNVCNKVKVDESEDWWLAWDENVSPAAGEDEQPAVKVMRWNNFLSHSSEVQHLCGARCLHTMLDRWMAGHL